MFSDPGIRCDRHTHKPFDHQCPTCNRMIGQWSSLARTALPAHKGIEVFNQTEGDNK